MKANRFCAAPPANVPPIPRWSPVVDFSQFAPREKKYPAISRSLGVMGAPLELQDAVRRQAAVKPLLLASLGSAALAAFLLFPLVGGALLLAPLSLAVVLSSVLAGFGLVLLALQATKPLLRRVSAA